MRFISIGKIGLKLTGIAFLVMACLSNAYSQNNNGICIDDSFYVPANSLIFINSDLKLKSTSDFQLEGQCVFFNSSIIELSDYFIGSGSVIFRGDLDVSIMSNNTQVGSLFAEMDGANIKLEGDLDVLNVLKLSSGKIITGLDNSIFVSSSDEDAIEYNENALSDSFIIGNLKRAVDEGGTYYYPLGNTFGYHPFYIRDASEAADVLVNFDESIPALWAMNGNTSLVKLEESGAWLVDVASGVDMQFTAGVSTLDDDQQLISGRGNVFYASDLSFSQTDIPFKSVSVLPYYLEGDLVHSSGIYALVKSSADVIEIANTILVNGHDDSRFKVDLNKFISVRLRVFDSFGREVFKSGDYQNDFDVQHMRSGTYFYYLKGKLLDGQSYSRNNFIEVIRPK